MIELQAITYRPQNGPLLFQDFSWQVQRGEAWAVLGPSGCGKSTLLYLLAGLRQPESGEIHIAGQRLLRPRPQTGLILQDYGLLPWATVRQNAALGLQIREFYGPDGTHAPLEHVPAGTVDQWIKRLGLQEVQDKFPGQISGGQRQRTAIARTLALSPDLLLMDEPFSSLDAPTRASLQDLMLELWTEAQLTLIIVTHSIEEAAILGQKILLLRTPPHTVTEVIDNALATRPHFRDSEDYLEVCRDLRRRLEEI